MGGKSHVYQLKVGGDELLRRTYGEYLQLVLPKQFHSFVYMELHQDPGHLGANRVLQMTARNWPDTARDINLLVTRVRSCLKQRRLSARAPLQSIVTNAPFELVPFDCFRWLQVRFGHGKKKTSKWHLKALSIK